MRRAGSLITTVLALLAPLSAPAALELRPGGVVYDTPPAQAWYFNTQLRALRQAQIDELEHLRAARRAPQHERCGAGRALPRGDGRGRSDSISKRLS